MNIKKHKGRKRKHWKRFLSIMLIVLLLLSSFPAELLASEKESEKTLITTQTFMKKDNEDNFIDSSRDSIRFRQGEKTSIKSEVNLDNYVSALNNDANDETILKSEFQLNISVKLPREINFINEDIDSIKNSVNFKMKANNIEYDDYFRIKEDSIEFDKLEKTIKVTVVHKNDIAGKTVEELRYEINDKLGYYPKGELFIDNLRISEDDTGYASTILTVDGDYKLELSNDEYSIYGKFYSDINDKDNFTYKDWLYENRDNVGLPEDYFPQIFSSSVSVYIDDFSKTNMNTDTSIKVKDNGYEYFSKSVSQAILLQRGDETDIKTEVDFEEYIERVMPYEASKEKIINNEFQVDISVKLPQEINFIDDDLDSIKNSVSFKMKSNNKEYENYFKIKENSIEIDTENKILKTSIVYKENIVGKTIEEIRNEMNQLGYYVNGELLISNLKVDKDAFGYFSTIVKVDGKYGIELSNSTYDVKGNFYSDIKERHSNDQDWLYKNKSILDNPDDYFSEVFSSSVSVYMKDPSSIKITTNPEMKIEDENYFDNSRYNSIVFNTGDKTGIKVIVELYEYFETLNTNGKDETILKNDFKLDILIQLPKEINLVNENIDYIKDSVSFNLYANDEEYRNFFKIEKDSIEYNESNKTLKVPIIYNENMVDITLGELMEKITNNIGNNPTGELIFDNLIISEDSSGYFATIITVAGEYDMELTNSDYNIVGTFHSNSTEDEKENTDVLYRNKNLLDNWLDYFPQKFSSSVSGEIRKDINYFGDLLVKEVDGKDFESESTEIFKVENEDEIVLQYKLDIYELKRSLNKFFKLQSQNDIYKYSSEPKIEILIPEGVNFKDLDNLNSSIKLEMSNKSDIYIINTWETEFNKENRILTIHLEPGFDYSYLGKLEKLANKIEKSVNVSDPSNPSIDLVLNISNLVVDSEVGEKLSFKSSFSGDIELSTYDLELKYDLKSLQQQGGKDITLEEDNKDITLTMEVVEGSTKRHEVVFETGDGGSTIAKQKVKDGNKVKKPTPPTREGYNFVEWQLNGEKYEFDTAVTQNLELVAKWESGENYKVSFVVDYLDEEIPVQIVKAGEKVTEPEMKSDGNLDYRFIAWYLDDEEYDFGQPVTGDITLKAYYADMSFGHVGNDSLIKFTDQEEYDSTAKGAFKVTGRDKVNIRTTVDFTSYINKFIREIEYYNNQEAKLTKHSIDMDISIVLPKEVSFNRTINNIDKIKKSISLKMETIEGKTVDLVKIKDDSIEFDEANKTLKLTLTNVEDYSTKSIQGFSKILNKVKPLVYIDITNLGIESSVSGYFSVLVMLDGVYEVKTDNPSIHFGFIIYGDPDFDDQETEMDWLYRNRYILGDWFNWFPDGISSSVSGYSENFQYKHGDLLVKNKDDKDYDSENAEVFKVENGKEINLRYKLDSYEVYENLQYIFDVAANVPIKDFKSPFVAEIKLPQGVKFKEGVNILDSMKFHMSNESDLYLLDKDNPPKYNEDTGSIFIYFKEGNNKFTNVDSFRVKMSEAINKSDPNNKTIDSILDISNLVIDANVGDFLTVESEVNGSTLITTDTLFGNFDLFLKTSQKEGGSDVHFPDENKKITLTMVVVDNSKYNVAYNNNGGTGSQTDPNNPYIANSEVTVLDKNDIEKENHTFTGWNTKADGTGTPYAVGAKFNITEDTTLYAEWKENTKPPVDPIEPEKPVGTIKDITLIGGKATLTEKVEEQLKEFKLNRISGKNRYATSVQVSKAYKNSDTVVLASGEKYTDELTATVLASKLDVPILLSEKDVVPEVVIKEIERLGATKVILIGEKGTLSKLVETQLFKYKLERIGGVDRYETAVLIGNQIRTITGNKTQSILVDGTNFPDAIAMTSMGVEQGLPIILTQPNELNKTTEKAVKDWGITKVTIGGGTASVSSNIESTLKATVEVERINGSDRYETSVLVAKQVYKNPTHAVVASGEVFPDAIVGAPYAAKNKYPIVLSKGNSIPQVVLDYVNGR